MEDLCFRCFKLTGKYDVCPHCGYIRGTPNEPEFMLQPNTRVWGRYLIGTILGIGGFGVTYKAFDIRLNTVVAIKEYFPQNLATRIPGESQLRGFWGKEEEHYNINKQKFIEEGKMLAKFAGDSHIVNVLDNFLDNNTAYIVMEYVSGVNLKEYISEQGGTLTNNQVIAISMELLQGIKSIHSKGIIHRDISPDNIYIMDHEKVKILDFGAAKFSENEEWTQSVVVKKGYAPPEQYRNNMKQSVQTDLYAVGATMYKMLTGITPEESIDRWEKDDLISPSLVNNREDKKLDQIIMKAMALQPSLRFKTADEMLASFADNCRFDSPEVLLKKRKRARISAIVASISILLILGIVGTGILTGSNDFFSTLITKEETLADKQILPDTITVWVDEGSKYSESIKELSETFQEIHPDYDIAIQEKDYKELGELNQESVEKPDVLIANQDYSIGSNADLSLLINGLDAERYYQLNEIDPEHTEVIDQIPIGLGLSVVAFTEAGSVGAYKNIEQSPVNEILLTQQGAVTSLEEFWILRKETGNRLEIKEYSPIFQVYLSDLKNHETGERDFANYRKDLELIYEMDLRIFAFNYQNELLEEGDGAADQVLLDYIAGFAPYAELEIINTYKAMNDLAYNSSLLLPIIKKSEEEIYQANYRNINATVSREITENKQWVAMEFIHYLLSDSAQAELCVKDMVALPVNKEVMNTLVERKPQMGNLVNYMNLEQAEVSEGINIVDALAMEEYVEHLVEIGDIEAVFSSAELNEEFPQQVVMYLETLEFDN